MNLREFRGILRQTLFFPVFLLLLLAVFVLWQIRQSSAALENLDRSDEVTSELVELQKLIIDRETGLRGFQLTGDPKLLAPYHAAEGPIAAHFANLRQSLANNPAQMARLADLRDQYQIWLGFAEGVLDKSLTIANTPRLNQQGKQLMDGIRATADAILKAEARLRRQRAETALRMERREFLTILAAAILVGLSLGIFTRNRLSRVSRTYNKTLQELEVRANEIYESRQWFQTTLESIGDAVIACDDDGNVKFMNDIAQKLTGWSADEAFGQPLQNIFHIIHEETRVEAENPVEKVRRLKQVVGLANHTALLSRDGKEYVIDDSAAPIRGSNGEMTGIVLVFREVTDARRTEAALIAGEKLAVAGRLAATIAHEIHNPLDSVANLLFLLRDENDPEKRALNLQFAEQELNRTMQISRTILSLYREPKAPIPVDLKDLIENVLLLLERRIAQQGIRVDCEFAESHTVQGFPAELRQVFTNLLVNALEAAGPQGMIRIRVQPAPAEEFRAAGTLVEISDSGPGLSDSASRSLFQPFYTTKGENGTGLGLWMSMGIVQKHGGTIQIANGNADGLRGATVRVYLPAQTLASAASRSTPHVA